MDVGLRKASGVSCYCPLSVFLAYYSLVCSLPIYTGSSANVEVPRAPCQLNSCKMLRKCLTDCIKKGMQHVNHLEGHSRSAPLLPFNRPYIRFPTSLLL